MQKRGKSSARRQFDYLDATGPFLRRLESLIEADVQFSSGSKISSGAAGPAAVLRVGSPEVEIKSEKPYTWGRQVAGIVL
jgi:hypothetical protein